MALFMKQDFTPPVLSRRWMAIKLRPNMLIYNRKHIINILESGLLFREDSIDVQQEAPSPELVWTAAGGGKGGWLTRGESVISVAAIATAVILFPPKSFTRSAFMNVAGYMSLPVAIRAVHRASCRGSLASLLANMRDYLALARRAAACLKEFAALHAQLGSLTSVIDSMHTLLCRQQSEMSILMSRASSALLGNAPWLHADVAWDAVPKDNTHNLMKIHHAFLVIQSTLLKHIAMAHYIPSPQERRLYRNYNERIYWIHTELIQHLNEEFRENYESLDRMYRLLKNSGNKDLDISKKLGSAVNTNWLYSDIHNGIARACLELKFALNKCNSLDIFLDSCALNDQNVDMLTLNNDVDELLDKITDCLTTVQNSQIRLRKLRGKVEEKVQDSGDTVVEETATIVKIEDHEPESKDEVFYFVKTDDDDDLVKPAGDLTTNPGKREKETTKIVLNELKRKLGKREDMMRERERQALVKTMPEFKDNVPEFPRQIKVEEYIERKGFILKINRRHIRKSKTFGTYKIKSRDDNKRNKKFRLKIDKYESESEIRDVLLYEANAKFNCKSKLLTLTVDNRRYCIVVWCKCVRFAKELDSSGLSEGLSDVEAGTVNKTINHAVNSDNKIHYRVTKKDLEITSSSESDTEWHNPLQDLRKHRVVRKKNHPSFRRSIDNLDESLRPIEYSLGTGLAMASVLQVNSNAKMPSMVTEEVFIGDGEVSSDSGNDEDA